MERERKIIFGGRAGRARENLDLLSVRSARAISDLVGARSVRANSDIMGTWSARENLDLVHTERESRVRFNARRAREKI